MYTIGVVVVLVILANILGHKKWDAFVFALVFVVPMRALVPVSSYILGFISPDNVATLFLIVTYGIYNNDYPIKNIYSNWSTNKKAAFFLFVVFSILLVHFDTYKTDLYERTDEIEQLPKRILRDSILVVGILLIFIRSNNMRIIKAVDNALIFGSSLIGLSIFFSDFFVLIGFNKGFNVGERASGFLSMNPNQAGHYMAFMIAYFLARIQNPVHSNIKYFAAIGFSLIGIMGTASRTALIASFVVFTFFLYQNRKLSVRNFAIQIGFFLVIYVVLNQFGGMIYSRIVEAQETGGGSLTHRQETWLTYYYDLLKNPEYLIWGNTDSKPTKYAPHNYYIKIMWTFGLVFLYLFLKKLYAIFMSNIKSVNTNGGYLAAYLVIVYLTTSITGNYSPHVIYIIIFALSEGAYSVNNPPKKVFRN